MHLEFVVVSPFPFVTAPCGIGKNALDKLFLKSQPLADRRRAVFYCKQTAGQKMSQLITEKDNERFAANTADMTQDDFFVIAILEMCTNPELSKRFREVKTDELTWC